MTRFKASSGGWRGRVCLAFGRNYLFQFFTMRLAKAPRVGTIQVRSRRYGEVNLAGLPLIQ